MRKLGRLFVSRGFDQFWPNFRTPAGRFGSLTVRRNPFRLTRLCQFRECLPSGLSVRKPSLESARGFAFRVRGQSRRLERVQHISFRFREEVVSMAEKYVYSFGPGRTDGDASMRNTLGGKGANLRATLCGFADA